jgi:hypothetical protein
VAHFDFEEVFAGANFMDLEPGRVRLARMNGSIVVLTHFFSAWFMTDQRIEHIAQHLE